MNQVDMKDVKNYIIGAASVFQKTDTSDRGGALNVNRQYRWLEVHHVNMGIG